MPFKFRFDGDVWSDTWMWEILSIILSGISLVSTFVVLKVHAQKPPPHFIYGITLNAIISFLTTLSKSSLLVAVAGAMSQLKWQWFQSAKGRSVLDTQLFDNASRGPWGSAILLTTPHSWSLVSMGAVVSILALAFDPFAQQLLNYPTQTTVAADPASRASNIYRAQSFVVGRRPDRTYSEMLNRVSASSWGQLSEAENFAAAQCPTGNCTWDEFESLALCSACLELRGDNELYYENGGELFKGILSLSWSDMQGNNGRLLNLNNTAFPRMLFTIDQSNSLPLSSVGSVFEGAITVEEGFADDERNQVSNASGIQFKKEFFVGSGPSSDALEPRTLNLQQIVDNGGLSWVIPRVAADLSRYIREQDGIPVLGKTFITITIVEVRWLWFLFPAVTWLCATAFLVLTMWTGCGGDKVLWKTSSLPLVYHGLGAREVEIIKTAVGGMEKVSDMEKSAKSLHARLRRDSINGQLKLSSAKAQEIEL
ncbi:hypothetical protein NUW58_g5869 [Xylaria curta]|uniref:Uncharacterized protein n=1 Tax=Xylaria curta TaxID=42375 RepID=A0ACC1NZJ3_9PEZI|nr:hypothetical protein NUW58_g5869 [Xylaria curta]